MAIVPAQAATTDQLKLIYRISGVADDGGDEAEGMATVFFFCTSFSNVTERLRFQVRNFNGEIAANEVLNIKAFETKTASTHAQARSFFDVNIETGYLDQGSMQIFATFPMVHCSAIVIDAAAAVPQGTAPDTQE